jgi:hypothetical protein
MSDGSEDESSESSGEGFFSTVGNFFDSLTKVGMREEWNARYFVWQCFFFALLPFGAGGQAGALGHALSRRGEEGMGNRDRGE